MQVKVPTRYSAFLLEWKPVDLVTRLRDRTLAEDSPEYLVYVAQLQFGIDDGMKLLNGKDFGDVGILFQDLQKIFPLIPDLHRTPLDPRIGILPGDPLASQVQ